MVHSCKSSSEVPKVGTSSFIVCQKVPPDLVNATTSLRLTVVVSGAVEGLKLPETLTLLHEHTDLHSLQCTKPISLKDLNKQLTQLCKEHGTALTKQQFVDQYPF